MPEMNEERSGFFLGPLHRERWTYACAKQLLERVIWAHGEHGALDFTIIRPFNVIGPRMDFLPGVDGEGVPRVLASFMNALLRGEPLPLVDGGHQRRSFISVHDFMDAIVRVVERPAACRGQVLNIGDPSNDVTIRKLAAELASVRRPRCRGRAPARRVSRCHGRRVLRRRVRRFRGANSRHREGAPVARLDPDHQPGRDVARDRRRLRGALRPGAGRTAGAGGCARPRGLRRP